MTQALACVALAIAQHNFHAKKKGHHISRALRQPLRPVPFRCAKADFGYSRTELIVGASWTLQH